MWRSVVGALVALLSLLGTRPPVAALAQGDPCVLQPSDRWEYADFTGVWEHHGMALDVDPRGCGVLTWRTYRACLPDRIEDCDRLDDGVVRYGGRAGFVLTIHDGASASGRIVSSSDWTDLGTRGVVLRLNDDGTLTAEWDDTPIIFCRPWAWIVERCGG